MNQLLNDFNKKSVETLYIGTDEKKFDPSKYKWTYFTEPDLDYKMTSIAIYENDFPSFIKRKLKQENLLK